MIRNILFWLAKRIIRKHFPEGLTPIFGSGDFESSIIAWKWVFEDEKWRRYKTSYSLQSKLSEGIKNEMD